MKILLELDLEDAAHIADALRYRVPLCDDCRSFAAVIESEIAHTQRAEDRLLNLSFPGMETVQTGAFL